MSNEKLIERLRDAAALPTGLYAEAANALEAAEKRIAELEAERENFHMEYRMKCDEETKRLERKLAVAREALESCKEGYSHEGENYQWFDEDKVHEALAQIS